MTVRSSPAAAPSSWSSKPGHEPAGAELDHLVAPLAAGERLVVDRAAIVHDHEVAGRGRALDGVEPGRALAQAVELRVQRLVGHLDLAAADLELLVLAELGLGADPDLDRELQRLALARHVAEVELRLADRDHARGVDRRRVPAGERVAHRLVEHGVAAHPLQDHRGRCLAGPEPGDAQVAAEPAGGLREPALDLRGRDLRLHAHAGLRKLCDGGDDVGGHRRLSLYKPGFVLAWLYTGPIGHLVAGIADWVALLWVHARYDDRRLGDP